MLLRHKLVSLVTAPVLPARPLEWLRSFAEPAQMVKQGKVKENPVFRAKSNGVRASNPGIAAESTDYSHGSGAVYGELVVFRSLTIPRGEWEKPAHLLIKAAERATRMIKPPCPFETKSSAQALYNNSEQ